MALKEELAGIVGTENVTDNPNILNSYSRDISFVKSCRPRVVVKPSTAEQVQSLVKWANQTATPLIPVSSGPPRFHGDSIPGVPGAVVVDLSGMNKIMRIDRRNRIAIIEPGVTYPQLQPELAKEGLRLSTPLLPRANKSVLTSFLEREPTLIPGFQWSLYYPLRSLEVVWGDGVKFRTGDAGNWSSLEEAFAKKLAPASAVGPFQTDFHKFISAAQGSMGIVTWASIKCEVLPELQKLFFVASNRLDNLIDFTYRLLRFRYGDELLLLNNFSLASILGGINGDIREMAIELPQWVVLVNIAGRNVLPEERVEFLEKDISDIAQSFGLRLVAEVKGARNNEVQKMILNPSGEPYWKLGYKGGCQDIFFLTTLKQTPKFVKAMYSVAETYGYPTSEIGVYLQPVHQGASCHCEFNLPYNMHNTREVQRIQKLFEKATEELLKQGAFFSRPYGIWADLAYNRDAQTRMLLKKIKGIFDPNNIMNPGKLCF